MRSIIKFTARGDGVRRVFHPLGLLAYALLLSAALWPTVAPLFKSHQNAPASDAVNGLITLDSFSQSDVAFAVLRQVGERRMLQIRESEAIAPFIATQIDSNSGPCTVAPTSIASPELKPLMELKAKAHQLNADLGKKLMGSHFSRNQWTEFIDCYLEFLQEDPKAAELWAGQAFFASERCARTAEVEDALNHVCRFTHDRTTASNLASQIDTWHKEKQAAH